MYCLSVLYPNLPTARFDLDYYVETHMRLVQERLGPGGMIRFELAKGLAGWPPEETAPNVMICNMYFATLDHLQSAFDAHHDELTADIRAYTSIEPQFQISEVLG